MFTLKLFLMLPILIALIRGAKQEKEFNLNFHQNDYGVKFNRIELVRYNKELVKDDNISVVTRKFNRTQPIVNFTVTLNKDMGYNSTFTLQAYTFLSNEYREFPLRFAANFCKALAADVAGITRLTKCGNFTGCPFVKDRKCHMCNFYPDEAKLPPFIPNRDYKLQLEMMYYSQEVLVLDIYAIVFRELKILF